MAPRYTVGRKEGTTVANVKTAISVPESLFERVEALAREMKTARSHVFVLAVEEFIRRHDSRCLLEAINAAYDDVPDPADQVLQRGMRRSHRQIVEGEW
jgi:antitoxin MazE6